MIGALVAVISLNLTYSLIENYGFVAGTLPITGATVATPIVVTSTNHGIPLSRVLHGIVSGVTGTTEANGLWVLTPVDANTLSLSTFTPQGIPVESVGVHAYTGGGQIQYAFPDYQILLGRQMLALSSAVASPRIVFVPTDGAAWIYESFGSALVTQTLPANRGSAEAQTQRLQGLYATELSTFEVYVTGVANPPSPNFGDLDMTQLLVYALYQILFEYLTDDIAKVLHESWPSQKETAGSMTQRGQQWKGIVQIKQSVTALPKAFVPTGTSAVFTVQPVDPLVPEDQTTITIVSPD